VTAASATAVPLRVQVRSARRKEGDDAGGDEHP
jgi:hypothetical protein